MIGILKWYEPLGTGFVYNAKTNALIKINKETYDELLEKVASMSGTDKIILSQDGEFSIKQDFSSFCNKEVDDALRKFSDSDQIEDLVEYTMSNAYNRKLVLEVTDSCNLRCKYCSYTINCHSTNPKAKGHSTNNLTKDTAISAINSYFEEYEKLLKQLPDTTLKNKFIRRNPPVIAFYGGEPLLRFSLIKELIGFVNKYYYKYNSVFTITTNGTLLTPSIMDFLSENNVELAISFDGTKTQHDKNRVYANGKGSFDDVYKSLLYLRQKHKKYTLSKVTIQSVDAPNYDKLKNDAFFKELSLDGKVGGVSNLRFLNYNDYGCEEINVANSYSSCDDYLNAPQYILNQILEFGKKAEGEKNKTEFILNYLSMNARLKEVVLKILQLSRNIHRGGLIPGQVFNSCYLSRACLFIDTQSNYHICERTDFSFPVGNVRKGIDKGKLTELYKEFDKVRHSKRCNECWLRILCPVCVAHLMKNGTLSLPNEDFCRDIKISMSYYLTAAFLLANFYPNTLDTLDQLFSETNDLSVDSFMNKYRTP